jgi:hypothetical protein
MDRVVFNKIDPAWDINASHHGVTVSTNSKYSDEDVVRCKGTIAHTEMNPFLHASYAIRGFWNHGDHFGHAMNGSKNWICLFHGSVDDNVLLRKCPSRGGGRDVYDVPIKHGSHDDVLEGLKECLSKLSKHGIHAKNMVRVLNHRINIEDHNSDASLMIIDISTLIDAHFRNYDILKILDTFLGRESHTTLVKIPSRQFKVISPLFFTQTALNILHDFDVFNNDTTMWIEWPLNWLKRGGHFIAPPRSDHVDGSNTINGSQSPYSSGRSVPGDNHEDGQSVDGKKGGPSPKYDSRRSSSTDSLYG